MERCSSTRGTNRNFVARRRRGGGKEEECASLPIASGRRENGDGVVQRRDVVDVVEGRVAAGDGSVIRSGHAREPGVEVMLGATHSLHLGRDSLCSLHVQGNWSNWVVESRSAHCKASFGRLRMRS